MQDIMHSTLTLPPLVLDPHFPRPHLLYELGARLDGAGGQRHGKVSSRDLCAEMGCAVLATRERWRLLAVAGRYSFVNLCCLYVIESQGHGRHRFATYGAETRPSRRERSNWC